jgi:hypothetical protein
MSENTEGTQTVTHVEKTEKTDSVAAPVTTDASQAKESVAVESPEDGSED